MSNPVPIQVIVLFDGKCPFCIRIVKQLIRLDKHRHLRFGMIQSRVSRALLHENGIQFSELNTVYLLTGKIVYTKSSAILEAMKRLPFPYSLLFIFKLIPSVLRNGIYQYVARNRYKWFGTNEELFVISPELKSRFIEAQA